MVGVAGLGCRDREVIAPSGQLPLEGQLLGSFGELV